MQGLALENREKSSGSHEKRPGDFGLRNAFARKVRREHPSSTIDATAAEYGLTYHEAKGAVYGEASRGTIDKAIKAGGWALALELFAEVIGHPLETYIKEQADRARRERIDWEQREADHQTRLVALADLSRLDRTAS